MPRDNDVLYSETNLGIQLNKKYKQPKEKKNAIHNLNV